MLQSFSLLPMIPILVLEQQHQVLKPSLLQLDCKETYLEPINVIHVLRPSEVGRYFPSAISECKDFACLEMTTKLMFPRFFIPRQILEKGVFQYVGNLVSAVSNPVSPPARL